MQFNTENYLELNLITKILNVSIPKIKNQLKELNVTPVTTNNKILITETQFKQLLQRFYPKFNIDKALKHFKS